MNLDEGVEIAAMVVAAILLGFYLHSYGAGLAVYLIVMVLRPNKG